LFAGNFSIFCLSGKNHKFLIMVLQMFLGDRFEQSFYLMGVFFFSFFFSMQNSSLKFVA